jgi:chromosome segregation ATPase
LKRKIKGQNEETQKLIHKYEVERARTNTVTAETIYKLEKEEDGEIKCIKLCHRSEIQELRKQYEESEQRHQKQTALFEEKIALLKIDYLAYRALKGEHKKLKDQLEAFEAQTSLLVESMVQQSRDSQECVDVQLAQASNQISELRYEKAANDEKMVGCVREAQGYEEERNAALFEVSELRNVVEDLKARVKGSKKRDAELTQALEREEKKENSAPKQQIQAFQPATINKQPNIKLYLTLWQVDETGSLSGKYEIVTSKSTADTLGPFKAFAEVAANNLPTTGQKDPLEVRHRKDMHQTPAAQRVAAEEHAKLFVQKGVFEIASTIKAHQDRNQALELENATLKDKVAEVKAQLEHARTGNKCTRDALAQLNEELKALNKDKEEANWTLREALVTSWTQVETLGQKLKQEQEKTLLKAHPERPGSHNYLKSAEEAIRPCGECLTSKLELSNYRNHMVRHHKEKENLRKALSKSHGENANLQQRLNQANVNITRLQTDANTAQHYHQKLLKRANKINDERKDLEEQLHRAQIELSGTKSRLSISETEVKSLSAEVVACKNELEVAKEKLEEDDMDDKVTQRHCLVLAQHQAVLKARAAVAERTLREEKTSCKSFREKLQRDVEELVKRTGGVGSSNHEVLGQWAIDEPGGSRS